jgi:hypothetical protein|tara:strand:- start:729 stop:998 length:270 start_codon:yes stop_codon:yes gene_type:complete
MKYIVGASIGGLFGFGMPLVMNVQQVEKENNEVPRIEESQPAENMLPTPIEGALILPDNMCGHIDYKSSTPKDRAKECLEVEIPVVPAI